MEEEDFLEKMGDFLSRKARSIRDRFTLDETDLIRAVGKNDVEGTRRVLDAGVDPDKADIIGRRPLAMAVDNNQDKIVGMLLKAGANPNLPGKNNDTPLIKAIFWENKLIIEQLLTAGANPIVKGAKGTTAKEEALATGVDALIALIENVDTIRKEKRKEQDKALHERQKAQAAKAKAQRAEAEKKAKEEAQKNAQEAAYQRYPGSEVDPYSALIKAIRKQDEEAVAMFLLKTEDVNIWEPQLKTTALLAAIQSKNAMATGLLLERGALPLQSYPESEHTGFSLAIQKKAYGLVAKIFELYPTEAKENLNDQSQAISPQFLAYKDPKLFNLLIKGGADPYFGGKEGQSPVVKAIAKGGLGILPVLVRHKIDLNKVVDERTPMQWAIFYNRMDWVQGLIAEGIAITPELIAYTEELGGREEILDVLKNQ